MYRRSTSIRIQLQCQFISFSPEPPTSQHLVEQRYDADSTIDIRTRQHLHLNHLNRKVFFSFLFFHNFFLCQLNRTGKMRREKGMKVHWEAEEASLALQKKDEKRERVWCERRTDVIARYVTWNFMAMLMHFSRQASNYLIWTFFRSRRFSGIDGIKNHNDLHSDSQSRRVCTDYPVCLFYSLQAIRDTRVHLYLRSFINRSCIQGTSSMGFQAISAVNQTNAEQFLIRKGWFYYVNFKRSDSFRWFDSKNAHNRVINHYHLLLDSLSLRVNLLPYKMF